MGPLIKKLKAIHGNPTSSQVVMIVLFRAQQRKIMASRSNTEIWMSAAASDIR